MSTAAPSAASSVAPAPAAPVAAPAEVGATGQPASPATRTIKPIPNRLPGVLEDGPEDASTPDAVAARARDARGRFTADGTPIVEKGAKPSQEPAPEPPTEPAIPEPPGEPKPFMFAGRPFKSQADAEHWAKSIEGRYKPKEAEVATVRGELSKAAESARGWHGEAQRLAARVAELEAGTATPAASETSATPPPAGIDWELYAEVSKVANEAGTPWKAQQWLQEQYDATVRAEIAKVREEAIENPRREAAAQAEMEQTASTLTASMAAHTNPDGTPAFPEFRDGEQARQVGELWRSLGLDPHLALTPGGAVAAVALYRMARGMDAQPAAPPPNPIPTPPPPDLAADAAAGLDGGRPLMPAAMSRRELDPSVARLVAGLKSVQLIRPGIGFEA